MRYAFACSENAVPDDRTFDIGQITALDCAYTESFYHRHVPNYLPQWYPGEFR